MKRVLGLTLALLLLPCAVFAHGDTPLPIEFSAVGDADWVLRTNFGLVTSAQPDRYVCEEAFAGGNDFQVGVLGLNEWLIFTRAAIIYSPDGCDFEIRQEIAGKPSAVAVSPDRSRVAYAINESDLLGGGVWWTDDAGETVRQTSLNTQGGRYTRAIFVDNSNLLLSAYWAREGQQGDALLIMINLDGGRSRGMPALDGLKYPHLLDVENEWMVWLARDEVGQRIFWGPLDEPTRYSTAIDSWPSGARLSDDGQTVWVTGVQDGARGVLVGDTSQAPIWSDRFTDHSALCVGRVGETYHLCARRDREGHDLARVGADGSLEPVVDFSNLVGARDDCPAGSDVASTCPSVWPELAPALGIEVEGSADAGVGGDVGSGSRDGGSEGGGCSTGGGGPVGALWIAGVAMILWRRGVSFD